MGDRERIVEAMWVERSRHADPEVTGPPFITACRCGWTAGVGAITLDRQWRVHVEGRVFDAALAVRTQMPCETCRGECFARNPDTDAITSRACHTCHGTGTVDGPRALVELLMRRIAWAGLVAGELDAIFEDFKPDEAYDFDVEEVVPMYVERMEGP